MPSKPAHVTDEQQAEHDAAADEALGDILSEVDSDLEMEVSEADEEQELAEEEPEEAQEDLPEEEAEDVLAASGDEAPAEEAVAEGETEQPYDAEQRHTAWLALKRDGLSEEAIDALPEGTMVAAGLKRHVAQTENDRVYRERDSLRSKLGLSKPTEAAEGQSGGSDPAQDAEATDPIKTGADLTSAALPVARALTEMDDPEKVAQELVTFTQKAVQAATGQQAEALKQLAARLQAQESVTVPDMIQRRLGPDFEGDLEVLFPEAMKLGNAGFHSDKSGIDRAVALVRDAQKLSGAPPKKRTKSSTSRARRRGAAPPINGRKTPPKTKTRDEVMNDRLRRILVDGERDPGKL